MEQFLKSFACKNQHNQPITRLRLNKQLSDQERFMCDQCEEQQSDEQILDIQFVEEMINDFKKKQKESIQAFIQFKLEQIFSIENSISKLKSLLLLLLEQLKKYTEGWRYFIQQINYQNFPGDFKTDIDNLIYNKWDDQLKEYISSIDEKSSTWIQKIEINLSNFQNFQEIQKCQQILKQSIILNDISPVRVKDNQISLALVNNSIYQNETCNAISINKTDKIIATSKENTIVIWEFVDRKMQFVTQLDRHKDYISCLVFSKKVDCLISASYDKTILCWKKLDSNKWICSGLNFQHTGQINCILLNKKENQLISGSSDQRILVWDVDCNQNRLNYLYPLQLTAGDVEGLTMNDSETILVSSSNNKSIIIWRKGNDDKWKFSTNVTKFVEEFGSRISFLNNNKFIWVSGERDSLDCICVFYEHKEEFLENNQKRINLQKNNKEFDFHLFPICYNQEKKIIIVKHKLRIYVLKEYPNDELKIAGTITCKSTRIFGSLTNDGQFLIYWDANGSDAGGGQYFIYKI
ncbi:unnamed protein product [Paramecium primaurelia]|uniref:WD domain, G-beta repeat protein n=1 Tax=Paramecium primaurelia TaxID=5886 RepID=A0A8S1P2Y1_PARPR|nr:unnamed protein product [Paramecium primaurelia]